MREKSFFSYNGITIQQSFFKLFTVVADTSDFLVDNLVEYFQGGLMDMAGWTHKKWHDAITMIENGTK